MRRNWLLVAAIVLVGLNLRSPITSLSPVLGDLAADLSLSPATAGLLTSLPVLCFAVVSPLVVPLVQRTGIDRAILLGLIGVGVAVAVRPWSGAGLLLAGTALAGAAITIGNVLIPVVVRRDFAHRPGPVLSLSTASLTTGAALAAALTAPLAVLAGWRAATAAWAVLVAVAAVVWTSATRRPHEPDVSTTVVSPGRAIWRHPHAWALAAFFGMQSSLYYAVTAWLPTMIVDLASVSTAAGGTGASIFQIVGIAGTLVAPVLAGRLKSWRVLAAGIAGTWMLFLAGLLLAPAAFPVWTVIGGLAQGTGFALALSLIALRAADSSSVRHLSAMVQTIGYTLGATYPVLVGVVFDATSDWTGPLVVVLLAAALMMGSGLVAGSSKPIRERG